MITSPISRPITSRIASAIAGARVGGASATIRQIATDSRTMDDKAASFNQGFFRTHHRARDAITSIQLEFPNWYATSTEFAPGADATINVAVEYPIGATPVRVYFGGSDTGTIPDGGTLLSDALEIEIPDGAEFAVKTFFQSTAGIIYTVLKGNNAVEKWQPAVSGLTDQTLTSTNPTTKSTNSYGPSAIIGRSKRPAFFLFGDSKICGSGESGGTEYKGELERTIGPLYAFTNGGRSGSSLPPAPITGFDRRIDAAKYCTHIISNHGINQLAGYTAEQVVASTESLAGLLSQPFYQATIAPKSSSSDGWTTTLNQTTDARNSERVAFNAAIRAGLDGVAGYIELADVVESSRDSGLWKAGYTDDGAHENATGYAAIVSSGVVDPL